jgi:hypothetical protein
MKTVRSFSQAAGKYDIGYQSYDLLNVNNKEREYIVQGLKQLVNIPDHLMSDEKKKYLENMIESLKE